MQSLMDLSARTQLEVIQPVHCELPMLWNRQVQRRIIVLTQRALDGHQSIPRRS